MENKNALLTRLEVIWWLITAIVAFIILFPLCNELSEYPFFWDNLLFIVVFITFSRLIFLLRYSFIAKQKYIKTGLIFVCIIVAFILIEKVTGFKIFLDDNGPEAIVGSLPREAQSSMMTYIKSEMMLFGVGSVISSIILPFRLVLSIWRVWNGIED